MRTLIACLLAGVSLCANAGPAYAAPAEAPENFPATLTVTGDVSCGQFIEDQRANNTPLMSLVVTWVWGFLIDHHGFLDVKPGHAVSPVDLPDQATVLSFLGDFCERNPLSDLYKGTVALLKSQRRSGLESTQAVIVGRLRVRKIRRPRAARATGHGIHRQEGRQDAGEPSAIRGSPTGSESGSRAESRSSATLV